MPALTVVGIAVVFAISSAPVAAADHVAYLVNVTVRPGYDFANAGAALAYGYGICDGLRLGEDYAQLTREVKQDFATDDDFQASYLISQAVDELCPQHIWRLRHSAAGYASPS